MRFDQISVRICTSQIAFWVVAASVQTERDDTLALLLERSLKHKKTHGEEEETQSFTPHLADVARLQSNRARFGLSHRKAAHASTRAQHTCQTFTEKTYRSQLIVSERLLGFFVQKRKIYRCLHISDGDSLLRQRLWWRSSQSLCANTLLFAL